MSDTQPEVTVDAPAEDRELAKAQLANADPEALANSKEELKTGTIEFRGEKFHVSEETGALPLLMFAAAADLPSDGLDGAAAIWRVLEDVIHEDEFARFAKHGLMARPKVQVDELLEVLNKAQEVITGTPTEQPSGSSGS